MNKFALLVHIAIASFRKNIKVNIFAIIVLSIGMILPLLAIADINVAMLNMPNLEPVNADNTYYCNFKSQNFDESRLEKIKNELAAYEVACYSVEELSIPYKERNIKCNLIRVSSQIQQFETYEILKGRDLFSDTSAEAACLLEENVLSLIGGDNCELPVYIDDTRYNPCGIFRSMDLIKSFVIPLGNQAANRSIEDKEINLFLRFESSMPESTIKSKLEDLGCYTDKVITSEVFFKRLKRNCVRITLGVIIFIIPAIVFSVINCVFVLYGKAINERYKYGLNMAVGATKGDIRRLIFYEMSIMAIISSLIDMIVIPIVSKYIPEGFLIHLNFAVYLVGFLLLELMCAFMSSIITAKVTKMRICEILKGV